GWKPGEPLVIDGTALAFPTPLKEVAQGEWYVSAVIDRDLGEIGFSQAPGNVYARATRLTLDPASGGAASLTLDKVDKGRALPETDTGKLVDIESPLLTKFHGRPARLRAGVVLPESYAKEPERRYPVVYNIPGFGGTHFGAARARPWESKSVEAIYVVLD